MSMDNNDPMDTIEDDFDTGGGLEDFDSGKTTLGDVWRNNPLVKIGVVLGAFATIIGGIILFGGQKEDIEQSAIRGAKSDLTETPGETEVSEKYKQALEDFNKQNIEDAARTGQSALPVPIGPARGRIENEAASTAAEDPLERWRRIQEERLRKEQQATPAPRQKTTDQGDPYVADKSNLAEAMANQMESILGTLEPKKSQTITVADRDFIKEEKKALAAEAAASGQDQAGGAGGAAGGGQEESVVEILEEAGSIEYARLITEANTDAPGPILAELASGPLAGSRLIGSFTSSDEYITLNFATVVVDGVAVPTSAIALDPKTANPGMVTDKDNKYFSRIILPAAASFIEGMGSAISDSGSTTVNVQDGSVVSSNADLDTRQEFFKGVEKAAQEMSDVLDRNNSNVKPQLRIAAGTPIGVLFNQSVEREVPASQTAEAGSNSMRQR